ncbi:hypothetical protein D3C87_664290 [compost metagenome]
MQDITAWLQGTKDYSIGLDLYAKYGTSSFLKQIFANGPTPFNIEKLEAELTSLAPPPAPLPEASKVKELVPVELNETPPLTRENYIPNNEYRYNRIKDEIKKKYKQLERNMWVLADSKKETTLHLTAKQILKLNDEISDAYRLIDYYDKHNVFPDQVVYVPVTDRKQLLMVRINRAKKRLNAPNCKNPEATKALIHRHETELAKLRGISNE